MSSMDRAQLADFLRTRREALQPEDVGLPRGPRRRTGGLRREEVAALAQMSSDYYGRLEQQRGPRPSEQMLASLARGLRLSLAERDHLFLMGGHGAPRLTRRTDHVDVGLMRVLDRLTDTPAKVIGSVGETLVLTPPAIALFGDETAYEGLARSVVHRWFTDASSRALYPQEDHDLRGRQFTADLRTAFARDGEGSFAGQVVAELLAVAPEFREVWARHEVGLRGSEVKRFLHPEVGALELHCQVLHDVSQSQGLLVFTAPPASTSQAALALLGVLGRQQVERGVAQRR